MNGRKEGGRKERGRGKRKAVDHEGPQNHGDLVKLCVKWRDKIFRFLLYPRYLSTWTQKMSFISKTLLSHLSELINTVHLQS